MKKPPSRQTVSKLTKRPNPFLFGRTFADELSFLQTPEEQLRRKLEFESAEEFNQKYKVYEQLHKADMRYLKRLVPGDVSDWNGAIKKLRDDDPTDFFHLLPLLGHCMLTDPETHALSIERWFYQKDDADPAVAKRARKNFVTLGKQLAHVGSGKISLTPKEQKLAAAARKKSNREANERRNDKQTVNRLVNKIRKEAEEWIQERKTPQDVALKEAFKNVILDWREKTPIQDEKKQNAIVAEVKKILFPTRQRES